VAATGVSRGATVPRPACFVRGESLLRSFGRLLNGGEKRHSMGGPRNPARAGSSPPLSLNAAMIPVIWNHLPLIRYNTFGVDRRRVPLDAADSRSNSEGKRTGQRPDSKSGAPQGVVGSNPMPSARKERRLASSKSIRACEPIAFFQDAIGQELARGTRGKRREPDRRRRRRSRAMPRLPSDGASLPGQVVVQFLSTTVLPGTCPRPRSCTWRLRDGARGDRSKINNRTGLRSFQRAFAGRSDASPNDHGVDSPVPVASASQVAGGKTRSSRSARFAPRARRWFNPGVVSHC
jgi:hypothetical protein